MKNWPQIMLNLCLVLSAGNASFGVALASQGRGLFKPDEWLAVSDKQLERQRGGFDTGTGLNVSFGLIRTVTINGTLVSTTQFNLPDVSKISAEQAAIVSAAIAATGIIQNGAGNVVGTSSKSQLPTATLIQNSLDAQKIQTLTTINAGVNSLGLFKSLNSQSSLRDALLGSMGVR